jgi:hypothetical protein
VSEQLAPLREDADLTFLLVDVNANMVHGWPPSPCALERVISLWGSLCHHVEWGVSRFIPSTREDQGCLLEIEGVAILD